MNLKQDEINANFWGEAISKNTLLYPNEDVVRYLAYNFKDKNANKNKKMLDIGFGPGRHLSLARDYGFDIYGIDYSKQACQTARKYFNLDKEIEHLDLLSSNFQNDYFDFILCFNVLYFISTTEIKKNLSKIYDLAKPGAGMLFSTQTDEDFAFARAKETGEQIEENFYLCKEIYDNTTMNFLSMETWQELFREAGFKIKRVQKHKFYKYNLEEAHCFGIFWLEK